MDHQGKTGGKRVRFFSVADVPVEEMGKTQKNEFHEILLFKLESPECVTMHDDVDIIVISCRRSSFRRIMWAGEMASGAYAVLR